MTTTEKIVVIDDERRMCDSLSALLTNDGYEVATYQNSVEAVESIGETRVDLVITDIKMPRLDGIEILRRVKAIDEGIPVLLMTGYASLDTALEAIAEGAYDYLLKPVEFAYLQLAVRRAMEKRRNEISRLQLMEELRLSNLILQRRIGEINALYEAGKQIGSAANLRGLLRQIVALASAVTEAQIGSIMLVDSRRRHLTIEAAIGLEPDVIRNTRLLIGESIAGYVAETGEALIVSDVENNPRFKRRNKEKYGVASLLCTPLRIKNKIIGVINMANKQQNQEFTADDLRLLTTFASQAAVAVDDAYQFARGQRRLAEYEILHEMSREVETIESLSQFGDRLVKKLKRIFPIDYGIWFVWDAEAKQLIPEGGVGQTDIPLTESGKIDVSKLSRDQISLSEIDLENFDFDDLAAFSDFLSAKLASHAMLPSPGEAYMAIPIFRNGELAHVFYFGSNSDEPYSDEDMSLAKLVISQSALLFEKEKALLNATRLMTMGNMISEISHDLRRPLTSIKGGIQLILREADRLGLNTGLFEGVETEIDHMNDLVRELVDFSKPDRYETIKVDLRLLVKRVTDLVARDMKKRNIRLESDFTDINWEVMVNRNQMVEVFLNLVMNAMEAMPNGGKLLIEGAISKPEHRNEEYLALRIIDTGIGISKQHLARIFDRYYTTRDNGTGLGLSVVERIVTAHNGTLSVDSTPGKGTIFTVFLPIPT